MFEDFELEEIAPPPPSRIQTVDELESRGLYPNDKIVLLDDSLTLLFPSLNALPECLSTIYCAEALPDNRFVVGIIDVVPMVGRVVLPAGRTATVTLEQVKDAIRRTEAIRNKPDQPLPDNSALVNHQNLRVSYYDEMALTLTEQGTLRLAVPPHDDPRHFNNKVTQAMRNRNIRVSCRLANNKTELMVELKRTNRI
jgi:hypothetical protein